MSACFLDHGVLELDKEEMLGDGYAAAERIALEPNGNPNYLSTTQTRKKLKISQLSRPSASPESSFWLSGSIRIMRTSST